MSITEKYELTLNNHTVEVIHKGFKSLNNNSLRDLKEVIIESIKIAKEKTLANNRDKNIEGFIPYNNFECSINWKIIK